MEIKQDVFVHNRFDVEVRDAKTGTVRQTATGFNVILDSYFSFMFNSTDRRTPFSHIAFGTGTGTPAATDKALFKQLGQEYTTRLETVYGYPTSHASFQIRLGADSYNGNTITEVGLVGWLPSIPATPLLTHAMLQDSEGNPIAIQKTNTDVVYITATFYCTYTPGGFGDNAIYPRAENNALVKWVLGQGWTYGVKGNLNDTLVGLRSYPFALDYSDDLTRNYVASSNFYIWHPTTPCGVLDVESKTLTIKELSYLDTFSNDRTIRTLGIDGIGAFVFPDASVMSGYTINGMTVGTGDGMTAEFSLGAPFIKKNSVSIFVDDAEKTEGVDYTLDYDSNCTNNLANYHSAELSLHRMPSQVKFGNFESQTPATDTGYYDPVSAEYPTATKGFYPKSVVVSQANPIWIDFLSAKSCNRMAIVKITMPAKSIDKMVIEHSDDNESWTAVSYTRDGQVYAWDEVAARYWRAYIADTNWTYSLAGTGIIDTDATTGASFFLGRTAPALTFAAPPAEGSVITANFELDVPYKTKNNLIRVTVVVSLQRG